jgi:imidazolonepropionase-like amidohydrolase
LALGYSRVLHQAATINASHVMRQSDKFGQIAAGFLRI